MIHTMLDIETLSTRHDALITEIGAVKFDADTIIDRFHVGIDLADAQERYGRHISASTVLYWLRPDRDDARAAMLALPRVEMLYAVEGFVNFVRETPAAERGSIWGKGSTFDNVLVKSACDAVGVEYPATYKQDECYRTFANRCPAVPYQQIGTAHVSIADAESQAVHLQQICKHLGVAL
jgi:exodeoxyribonuclease VIII